MSVAQTIAQALLEIQAVGFKPEEPITFKSGIKSPVYIDNRKFPFHPQEWTSVIKGFAELIKEQQLEFDVIAGIETAGIPHSAALGFFLKKPSLFIRKQVKDHGTKKRVEGGSVQGLKVLLIEDHISTGMSSLSGVEAIRSEGGVVTDCLAITSFEFKAADAAFNTAQVKFQTLTNFSFILREATQQKKITEEQKQLVEDWLKDPHSWAGRHGF